MTRYLLDTSALIDFSKDQQSIRRFILEAITDTLTAAVAAEQKAILVTGNVKDFPMEEIELLALTPER